MTNEQQKHLDELSAESLRTLRPTVKSIEDILQKPFAVLDHGFVRVVDYMGDDSAVVQAARVSYGRGTKRLSEDRALIRYLMRHWHTTPFEMAEIKLHVKLPIFVARQWIRHRTANVNEISGRYSILDKEFYIPAPEHLASQSATNRQGRGSLVEGEEADRVLKLLANDATTNYEHYIWMLNEREGGERIDANRKGVARELARMNLTLNSYTQWYWKTDLHNLLAFLRLRSDTHAQYEIRAYAETIRDIVQRWVPLTYEAFRDYRMEGAYLSKQQLAVVRRMVSGHLVRKEEHALASREWEELMELLECDTSGSGTGFDEDQKS